MQPAVDIAPLSLSDVSQAIAAFFAFVAAWFELRDRAQSAQERKKTRAWYGHKWTVIRDSGLLRLPETVVAWVIGRFQAIGTEVKRRFYGIPAGVLAVGTGAAPFLGVFALWRMYDGFGHRYLLGLFLAIGLLAVTLEELSKKIAGLLWVLYVLVDIFSFCLFLQFVLEFDTAIATVLTIVLIPVATLTIGAPLAFAGIVAEMIYQKIPSDLVEKLWLVGLSVTVSFPLTMVSLAFGSALVPDAPIPRTLQLMLSNVFFDGVTVLTTLAILKAAIDSRGKFPLWLAVPFDLVVAALLACLSLWVGLLFTNQQMSFVDVVWVLGGLSPASNTFQPGPYFWAMHTTFLPTSFYLGVIALCYVGKLLILPIAVTLKKGIAAEKPHSLTAGLLLFIGAAFLSLSWGTRTL